MGVLDFECYGPTKNLQETHIFLGANSGVDTSFQKILMSRHWLFSQ